MISRRMTAAICLTLTPLFGGLALHTGSTIRRHFDPADFRLEQLPSTTTTTNPCGGGLTASECAAELDEEIPPTTSATTLTRPDPEEDEPGWDCNLHGNRLCIPANAPRGEEGDAGGIQTPIQQTAPPAARLLPQAPTTTTTMPATAPVGNPPAPAPAPQPRPEGMTPIAICIHEVGAAHCPLADYDHILADHDAGVVHDDLIEGCEGDHADPFCDEVRLYQDRRIEMIEKGWQR